LGDGLQSPLFVGDDADGSKKLQNTATIATSPLSDENTSGDVVATISITETTAQAWQKVRFLESTPDWVGADGVIYGPFKRGEDATLPSSEAKWAIGARLAQTAEDGLL
jgi:hypothetical protein